MSLTAHAQTPAPSGIGSITRNGHPLAYGTRVNATIRTALSSRTSRAGDLLRATVSRDVEDAGGTVVIPAGSTVMLTIAGLNAGVAARHDECVALVVRSVIVNAHAYPLTARMERVPRRDSGNNEIVVPAGTAIVFVLAHTLTVRSRLQ